MGEPGPGAAGQAAPAQSPRAAAPGSLVAGAWLITLAVGALPVVAWRTAGGGAGTGPLPWIQAALLALLLVATAWSRLAPLRRLVVVLAVIHVANLVIVSGLQGSDGWRDWFAGRSFLGDMLAVQLPRLAVAGTVVATLLLLRFSWRAAYLARGDLRAPIEPVRWLGFPKPDPWTRFGGQWAVYVTLGTLAFVLLGGRVTVADLAAVLPGVLPAVLLIAALNAVGEEVTYRAGLLAPLVAAIGPRHALGITAVNFGLAHYYGVPNGVLGVVMATFLGYLLGKAMLETRGFGWAWFIHVCQDVAIFTALAAGLALPG
jgi:membrane protease YdiL (CAAX protease family)